MTDTITVFENGRSLTFTFDMINAYHGGVFPGGVAHALKAMQASFPLFSSTPLERRDIFILTAFSGPGGRDALEMVTRALTDGRLTIDQTVGGKHAITDPPGPYLFRFSYRGQTVEAIIRPGHVKAEFINLGAKKDKTPEEIAQLEELKAEMANRLVPLKASDVYDARLMDCGNE